MMIKQVNFGNIKKKYKIQIKYITRVAHCTRSVIYCAYF